MQDDNTRTIPSDALSHGIPMNTIALIVYKLIDSAGERNTGS